MKFAVLKGACLAVLVGVALAVPGLAKAAPSPLGAWTNVAPLPQSVFGGAAATDGTFVYVFGGYHFPAVPGSTLNTVYRYNLATDTWTTLSASAPMPNAALMASAVYYPPTNKIYVFGGSTRTPDPVVIYDVTRIYDIATNTWSMGPTMPATRQQMASGYNSTNGKIYLQGGFETSTIDSVQATTWEFDPVANTFTAKAPSPATQAGPTSGVINGKLYVAGGRTNPDEVLSNTWGYDIATNTWSALDGLADMPMAKNVPGRAVVAGQLYSIGGTNVATFDGLNDVSKYDPAGNAWSPVPLLNTPRSFTSSVAVGNTIIAAGGRADVQTSLDSVEKLVIGGPTCPAGSTEVSIGDNFFNPATVNVPVGTTVCWRNMGQLAHTATSDTGVFNSPTLNPGDVYSFTFNSGGTYPYHCNFHLPTMTGTVIVGDLHRHHRLRLRRRRLRLLRRRLRRHRRHLHHLRRHLRLRHLRLRHLRLRHRRRHRLRHHRLRHHLPPRLRPLPRPALIGLRLGVAKQRITRANCRVGRVRRVRTRRSLRGRVVGQSPRPGAVRARGFHVNLGSAGANDRRTQGNSAPHQCADA